MSKPQLSWRAEITVLMHEKGLMSQVLVREKRYARVRKRLFLREKLFSVVLVGFGRSEVDLVEQIF